MRLVTARVRRFKPIDSPWNHLFEWAHTPSYRELLVEFLSSLTFHPPRVPVPLPHPDAPFQWQGYCCPGDAEPSMWLQMVGT
ncbi:hypothetical protein Hanom_Chr09g00786041 [Helianthus anomalus]